MARRTSSSMRARCARSISRPLLQDGAVDSHRRRRARHRHRAAAARRRLAQRAFLGRHPGVGARPGARHRRVTGVTGGGFSRSRRSARAWQSAASCPVANEPRER